MEHIRYPKQFYYISAGGAGWNTLDTQNNSLIIDLLEDKTQTTIKETIRWIQSVA